MKDKVWEKEKDREKGREKDNVKDRGTDKLRDKEGHVNNHNQWWAIGKHNDLLYMSKIVSNKMIWLRHSVEDLLTESAELSDKDQKEEWEEPILVINQAQIVDNLLKEEETLLSFKIDQYKVKSY